MALTKKEHIEYWLKSAEDDLDAMNYLFKGRRYIYALFFGHLYLEKIIKAAWTKNHKGNNPPFSHNLTKLLNGLETGLSKEDMLFLDEMNVYQLKGRYPDYANSLKIQTTKLLAEKYIERIKKISQCLQENI